MGRPGTRLIRSPESTRAIGKGNLKRFDNTARNETPKSNNMISAIFSI
jgi:hypothetical protein